MYDSLWSGDKNLEERSFYSVLEVKAPRIPRRFPKIDLEYVAYRPLVCVVRKSRFFCQCLNSAPKSNEEDSGIGWNETNLLYNLLVLDRNYQDRGGKLLESLPISMS